MKNVKLPYINNSGEESFNSMKKSNALIMSSSEKNDSLSFLKKSRKEVEYNSQMIINRIAHLQEEDYLTLKKIEEMRIKAMKIYQLKQINDQRRNNVKLLFFFLI